MKTLFWISLFFPLAVMAAEDIDYFNESIEHVNTPGYTAPGYAVPGSAAKPPVVVAQSGPKKGWGQGFMEYFEKLTGPEPTQPTPAQPASTVTAPATTAVPTTTPQPNTYLQSQLKAKAQEIVRVRQQILQTTDGHKLQELTGTLHRLEAEYHQLSENLKQESATLTPTTIELSPMAAPTPPVEKIMSQQPQPLSIQASEEDVLKSQLATLVQQERELSIKIKSTPDANVLSTLASQLERVQQNKSLVMLSLKDVQRRNIQNSPLGFAAALLPPTNQDIAMPVPTLTPSLEQVMLPALPTYPAGWGGFGTNTPIQPTGKPMTAEEWKQAQSQAEASFEDKQTHTTYGAPKTPLWTPKDHLGSPQRKSVTTHAPIDHRHLVEKIRKEKIFS